MSGLWIESLAQVECPGLTARRRRRQEQSGAAHDPIVWHKAFGHQVTDVDGKVYVDLCAGFGVAAVGHRHPKVQAALERQSQELWHALGDLHPSDTKILLLQRLAELAPFKDARVMLGLSGSDAVEAALKTAILSSKKAGVLAFHGAYHGLSYGSTAICGYREAFRAPFAKQLNPSVVFAPYPNESLSLQATLDELDEVWRNSPAPIGAVVVETIQARGGVRLAPVGFLQALRTRCSERGALLIVDEIYTGLGRCGAWWDSSNQDIQADVLCLGKALGGGLPISACIASEKIMRAWGEPEGEALHTSTFAGYPLACATALATLQVIEDENLPQRSAELGTIFMQQLQNELATHKSVKQVRGKGLMIGVVFHQPNMALTLHYALLRQGFITLVAGAEAEVLQLSPPLNIPEDVLRSNFTNALQQAIESCT